LTKKNFTFIDGDSLIFRCCYGNNISNAELRRRWDAKLNHISVNTFADETLVAIKGVGNFRLDIYPEYKANRPPLDPVFVTKMNYLIEHTVEGGAIKCDGWEADDQVVAWAYEADKAGDRFVIAAIDKDILQHPGNHYNYGGTQKKPIPEDDRWTFTSVEDGWMRFCGQLLTGDVVDNIIAIKGIGPAKAKKALAGKTHNEMMSTVVQMYKDFFGADWEDKLHVNCNLIYMRRWLEDEFIFGDHID
jgi:5'-3' exonuclease